VVNSGQGWLDNRMTDIKKKRGAGGRATSKKERGSKSKSQTKSEPESQAKLRPVSDRQTKPRSRSRPVSESASKGKSQTRSGPDPSRTFGKKRAGQAPEEVVATDEIVVPEIEVDDDERSETLDRSMDIKESSGKPVLYDPVSAYYQTIRHYPVLTRDKEKELGVRYLETEDVEAAYTLVTSNLKLVIKIALEYRRLWREIVDLIQEGNVGLMQAVKKYDPYRGVRFSSYAAWWIRAYIIRYIMNNTRMVKIGTTQAQRTLYFQLGKERERLRQMGIEPDSKAIAKSLKLKESEVEEMSMRLSTGDLSLEAKRGHDGDYSLYDTIPALEPDTESRVADAEAKSIYLEKLSEFVGTLADRDRKIFTMRWMKDEPLTLQQVGEKLGITRERVRQLESRIIKNLREYLENEGLSASDFFS
jgi:RNA polymerase sigma-32 factor